MTKTNEYTQDPSVNDVIDSIIDRSNRGMSHYGVSIRDNTALTIRQWLEHAREEMTDAAVYLTKIMEEMELLEANLHNAVELVLAPWFIRRTCCEDKAAG